jgi:DNA-directed RNA polymerase subunit RPC12/RpoP
MTSCQNCGKLNSDDTSYCRFCGTKFVIQQSVPENPFQYPSPRPYAWQTDEYQTQTEPRPTMPIDRVQPLTEALNRANLNYRPSPLAFQHPWQVSQQFRCPRCMSQNMPRMERRISTAGWITFAILLASVAFAWLCWIGLLIKEDVAVCQTCNFRLS